MGCQKGFFYKISMVSKDYNVLFKLLKLKFGVNFSINISLKNCRISCSAPDLLKSLIRPSDVSSANQSVRSTNVD